MNQRKFGGGLENARQLNDTVCPTVAFTDRGLSVHCGLPACTRIHCVHKNKVREFLAQVYLGLMNFFITFGGHTTQDTTAAALPTKPAGVILFKLRRSILMTSCRTETETVSRMQKAGPFDWCCSHQSVASPSQEKKRNMTLTSWSRGSLSDYSKLQSGYSVFLRASLTKPVANTDACMCKGKETSLRTPTDSSYTQPALFRATSLQS